MKTNIKTTKTTLTPSVRLYIESKLIAPLEKLLHNNETAILDVELELTTKHHKKGSIWRAEANLTLGGMLLRAVHTGEEPYEVIDLLEEEIMREYKRFKNKKEALTRRGARKAKNLFRKIKK